MNTLVTNAHFGGVAAFRPLSVEEILHVGGGDDGSCSGDCGDSDSSVSDGGSLPGITVTADAESQGAPASSPVSNVLWAGSGITAFGAAALGLAAITGAPPLFAAAIAAWGGVSAAMAIAAAIAGLHGQ